MLDDAEVQAFQSSYRRASIARTILAFLVCPALPYLSVVVILSSSWAESLDDTLKITFLLSSMAAGMVALIVGLPMYLLLCRWCALSLGHFLFWGGMIAFVLSLPVFLVMPITIPLGVVLSTLLWLTLVKLPPVRIGAWTI
ncbi:hypothetical protein EOI86_14140 [Hwanghaeella grinnelliae]|uniref:Uncharacterized protein n=1 Tax=Hwanghaeella grinnelliae TaxID=2500179 RepID=A0A437QPF9_9PROT|nr:hypothetical protein [Hwanghaeella grinnelliae]RVU36347.1 hypothetical protein EOI86_14140 [Hwanghaeella grinnelliae]